MFTFSFRNFSGLIVFLIAVLGIELFAAFPPTRVLEFVIAHSGAANNDNIRVRTATAALGPNSKAIVLVGSSRVREGFDAAMLKKRLQSACGFDGPVVNLGTSGGGQLDLPYIVQRVLPKKPSLLVLTPSWRHFYGPGIQNNLAHHAQSWRITARIVFALTKLGLLRENVGTIAPTLLAVGLPSSVWFRQHRAIELITKRALLGPTTPFPFRYYKPLTPKERTQLQDRFLRFRDSMTFQYAHSFHQTLFRETVENALAAGTKVIILDELTSPEFEAPLDRTPFRSDHLRFVENLTKELGVIYIDRSEMPELTSAEYVDLSHPAPSGRAKLTMFLAQTLLSDDTLLGSLCKPTTSSD